MLSNQDSICFCRIQPIYTIGKASISILNHRLPHSCVITALELAERTQMVMSNHCMASIGLTLKTFQLLFMSRAKVYIWWMKLGSQRTIGSINTFIDVQPISFWGTKSHEKSLTKNYKHKTVMRFAGVFSRCPRINWTPNEGFLTPWRP